MAGGVVRCNRADCFQNRIGRECKLLISPINGSECPFHKTKEQVDADRKAAHDRLIAIDRTDLIEKYEYNSARRGQW